MKKLLLAIAATLSLAAPVGAVPVEIPIGLDGRTAWMFGPDFTGDETNYFVEVIRMDADGDILLEYTDVSDRRLGYSWVNCSTERISFDGGEWKYVDHRNTVGWHYDIACGRPVK